MFTISSGAGFGACFPFRRVGSGLFSKGAPLVASSGRLEFNPELALAMHQDSLFPGLSAAGASIFSSGSGPKHPLKSVPESSTRDPKAQSLWIIFGVF